MKLDYGINIYNENVKWLKPAFDKWNEMIHLYCYAYSEPKSATCNDVPYYYTERSNVSLLCGAAWQSGFVALEEFSNTKTKTGEKRNGRADLYIYDYKSEKDILIEAKMKYVGLESESGTIAEKFSEAISDARDVDGYSDKAGLVFYVPAFAGNHINDKKPIEAAIKTLLRRFEAPASWKMKDTGKYNKPDCMVWSFPDKARSVTIENRNGYTRHYPGVIMCLKKARRTSSA